MRKFLATLLALVMTLALMVPASWGENKETYQLPDSLEGKTVILHTQGTTGLTVDFNYCYVNRNLPVHKCILQRIG